MIFRSIQCPQVAAKAQVIRAAEVFNIPLPIISSLLERYC